MAFNCGAADSGSHGTPDRLPGRMCSTAALTLTRARILHMQALNGSGTCLVTAACFRCRESEEPVKAEGALNHQNRHRCKRHHCRSDSSDERVENSLDVAVDANRQGHHA